jgi:hypothetical protein
MDYQVPQIEIVILGNILCTAGDKPICTTKTFDCSEQYLEYLITDFLSEEEISNIKSNNIKLSISVSGLDKNGILISRSDLKEF